MSLQYHIDNTECCCDSPYPIGSCLHCDLKKIQTTPNETVTEAMAQAGSDFACNAIDATCSKAMGGLGGCLTWDEYVEGFKGENLDLLKQYADQEINSVTGIYLAMERARVK